jgi:enoyl-CoA hydratase/carnithine racemase
MTHVFQIPLADPGAGRRLDPGARGALRAALREAGRSDCGAVLVTVDQDAWAQDPIADRLTAAEIEREFHALLLSLFALDRPVVVHTSGRVSGFGLALALAGDVRVGGAASTYATGGPAMVPLGGLAWLLTERASAGCAGRLAWLSTSLSAEEALREGLVSRLGDATAAQAEADRLAALPSAVTSTLKRSLGRRVQGDFEEQLGYDAWLALLAVGAS